MVVLVSLLACGTTPVEPEIVVEPQMDAVELLIRTSLDVRGVRPSIDDISAVESDPEAIDALIDTYLYDAGFGQRVRDLFAEIYLTRSESLYIGPASYGYGEEYTALFEESVGDEALQLLSYVAENDLPWTDIVTADHTMGNDMLTSIWPMEREDGEGWTPATYTDGRPHAGVLSMNSMWWRYTSTTSNANRSRANAVSRILLCNDYLTRPIDFDRNINLLDDEAVLEALKNDPACVNCHVSLDPLASYLFGFFWYNPDDATEASTYKPERELLWRDYTDMEPAYYGEPGANLWDLGQQIAGDNRFVECAVEQVYEGLLRRDVTVDDAQALTAHREAFLASDLNLRALMRSVLEDERYRSGDTDSAGFVPRKMATPDLLGTQVQGLTGFEWTYGGFDLMRTDRYGYRTLAGGADGYATTAVADRPNTTLVLVQERLAQAASAYAVAQAVETGSSELFAEVDFTETPDSDREAMVAQIQHLHLAIFGNRVDADGPEVEANLELWTGLYAIENDAEQSWAGVLSVLLRDPDLLFY